MRYEDENIWLTQKIIATLYDVTAQATKRFFATVPNRLHWAIHGQTAAEVVVNRADADKQHMGLTTWKDGGVASLGSPVFIAILGRERDKKYNPKSLYCLLLHAFSADFLEDNDFHFVVAGWIFG
ncbi:MAG: hypothetical protein HQQ73_09460 [Desulfobulbaceae bacterium]|nr:hypothetical protein [Desulfobulbaceae bacterium]